jgi:hypothetical protein
MQKWEYLEEKRNATGDLHSYLIEKGYQGWELCAFTQFPGSDPKDLLIIFKRPKP